MAQEPAAVRPQVRAADDSGNLGPPPRADDGARRARAGPAARRGGARAGRAPARSAVGPPRARMSRRGVVRLRVTCPPGARAC